MKLPSRGTRIDPRKPAGRNLVRGRASLADPGVGYRGDNVYATQAHFIDCLETGRPFETGARDYLEKTFAVVEAAYAICFPSRSRNRLISRAIADTPREKSGVTIRFASQ